MTQHKLAYEKKERERKGTGLYNWEGQYESKDLNDALWILHSLILLLSEF